MMNIINKHDLKGMAIDFQNSLDQMAGKLIAPACTDNETGELRARIYQAMSKLNDVLKDVIREVY